MVKGRGGVREVPSSNPNGDKKIEKKKSLPIQKKKEFPSLSSLQTKVSSSCTTNIFIFDR